jgi:hypothetical protein
MHDSSTIHSRKFDEPTPPVVLFGRVEGERAALDILPSILSKQIYTNTKKNSNLEWREYQNIWSKQIYKNTTKYILG